MRTEQPPLIPMVCVCGHPVISHHHTGTGRITYCTCWSPTRCECPRYEAKEEDE